MDIGKLAINIISETAWHFILFGGSKKVAIKTGAIESEENNSPGDQLRISHYRERELVRFYIGGESDVRYQKLP